MSFPFLPYWNYCRFLYFEREYSNLLSHLERKMSSHSHDLCQVPSLLYSVG